jgi:AbrB family looped-hinge helix DNA binding protein
MMTIAKSKLTAQGQISVPAEVRQRLGVGPGSVLEWDEQDDQVVVRRAGRYSSEEVHSALFPAFERAITHRCVPVRADTPFWSIESSRSSNRRRA